MKHCDTLILPRWCAPVRPSGSVLTAHALVVTEGRIQDLLPRDDALRQYQPSQVLERPDHLLIPGLVNTHTHAAMTLFRGLADDMPLEQWLTKGIWPAEKRWVSEELVRDGTALAIAEMLRSGTTCFSDQYFFPETVAASAVNRSMRVHVGTPVIDFATQWASTPAEHLQKGADLVHDAYVDHPLVSTCFAPHSTYSVSDETFVELRVMADQLDVPVQIHLHESATEVATAIRETGMRPFERLDSLGLVNSSLMLVHAVHMEAGELRQIEEAGVSIAHCPKSNLKLASGIAPVAAYKKRGICVGIGTDGAASNNTLDMLSEMQYAALLGKASANDAAALTAGEVLEMATIDGARALGLDHDIGSLEAGKWADVTCVDLSDPHCQPVYDPVAQLVYSARAEQVSDVWVAGRHLLDNHVLCDIDIDNLNERCSEWAQRIQQGQ